LPQVRVSGRWVRSGVDAHANPGTSITGNRTARWGGEAKSWPDRPKGTIGPESRDCIPGWWSWPYRPQSQSGRWGSRVCMHYALTDVEGDGAFASGTCGFLVFTRFRSLCINGPSPLPVHVHLPPQLRFRPVRPAPSAWHEMPGHASPRRRRPARAALSRTPPCDGWYAWCVAGRWWISG
jgi:hypothetical protein